MLDLLSYLPPWGGFLAFTAAALALNLTPGIDMTYVITRSVGQGRQAGLAAALGIAGGSLCHTLAAALGVTALLAASQTAFLVLKYIGAAYLLYLAIQMLRSRSSGRAAHLKPQNTGRVFFEAVGVNLLNPKVGLFVLAFIPQFVDPARGSVAIQIIILGSLLNIMGTGINIVVACSSSAAASRIKGSDRAKALLRWIAATILGGLAIRLALSERN